MGNLFKARGNLLEVVSCNVSFIAMNFKRKHSLYLLITPCSCCVFPGASGYLSLQTFIPTVGFPGAGSGRARVNEKRRWIEGGW